ncbi:MAG: hypothetical protein QM790_16150 [Nibricoccus sp.]
MSGTEPDLLGSYPGIVKAEAFVRAPSGRYDAGLICHLFGFSTEQFAKIIGSVSEESIRVEPDSVALQPTLQPFAKIARILCCNPDPVNFRNWLNTPNTEFNNISLIEVIKTHGPALVADLVEDILTGMP